MNLRVCILGLVASGLATAAVQGADMSHKVRSPDIATKIELKRSINKVKGLLVSGLPNGDFAGIASNMIITANKVKGGETMSLRFSQPVGESMRRSVTEAIRGLQIKYGGWPKGFEASISFQEKYIPKDGPSAAVACALLLDGLINGTEYDPGFAVTGDMNSDLTVQPIGGVAAKIRGATKAKCTVVAVPYGNASALADIFVQGDLQSLADIQVFTVKSFEDAKKLAAKERDEDLSYAIGEFSKVQQVIKKSGVRMVRNQVVQKKLAAIVKRAPGHVSARLLMLAGQGRGPKTLSLAGSFTEMNKAADPFLRAIAQGDLGKKLADQTYGDALFKMREMRPKLDARTRKYHDAMTDMVSFWREWGEKKISSRSKALEAQRKFNAAVGRLNAERDALRANKEIADEMMSE